MRFPSFKHITDNTIHVLKTYPLECITSFAGTVFALILSDHPIQDANEQLLIKLLMIASLGLPSFLAITIRNRFRGYNNQRRVIEYSIIAIILLLLFFSFDKVVATKDVIRFFLLNITAHLMVSCAGFIKRGSTHAFWQFNKALFLQIVTAVIFSSVLYAGLAGAIAAMDVLFALKINGQWYFRLYIVIAGLFNTFFFLSGVPQHAQQLEQETEYPKVLKIFAQFVLVPLVIIYLIILLVYEAKIIALWSLPQGWVSNLILAYGVAGILSILLVYPIRSSHENSWIKIFAKWFYVLLIPLVVLMFVAIGIRIGTYGFTEERVLVLALAIWLAFISLCYLFKPNTDIRLIPLSLACVAILLNFSAFPISKSSQKNRLQGLLQKNNLLSEGKATKAQKDQKISFKDRKNISSIMYYLMENHGKESLQPWFNTDSLKEEKYGAYNNAQALIEELGIEYVDNYVGEDDSVQTTRWVTFFSKNEEINIQGFDFIIPLQLYYGNDKTASGRFHINKEEEVVTLRDSNLVIASIYPRIFFTELTKKYKEQSMNERYLPTAEMRQDVAAEDWSISIFYKQLSGYTDTTDSRDGLNYEGFILLKKK